LPFEEMMLQGECMKPTLLIMAAGMGSRYGGLKQIDPMGPNGETLLEYSVFDAIRAGFGKVVFVIRRDFADAFKKALGNRFDEKIEVAYAFQELDDLPEGFSVPSGREKPWGTAHAIFSARDQVQTPFAVQNADDFYGPEAYQVLAEELQKMPTDEACMVGYELANTLSEHGTVSRGICQIQNGYLQDVEEHLKIARTTEGFIADTRDDGSQVRMAEDEICSMNFWGFAPPFFNALKLRFEAFLSAEGNELKSEWLIPPVVDDMIKKGEIRVKVLRSSASWFGVTYPQDKPWVVAKLEEMHKKGIYPARLWE
jgi:choline kinase